MVLVMKLEPFGYGGYGPGYGSFGPGGPYPYSPCCRQDSYTYGPGGDFYNVFQQLSTVFFDGKYLLIHISLESPSNMVFNLFV